MNHNNTSGYKGVYFNKHANKWISQIVANNKIIYIGCFLTLDEARDARTIKANESFKDFTNACEVY